MMLDAKTIAATIILVLISLLFIMLLYGAHMYENGDPLGEPLTSIAAIDMPVLTVALMLIIAI